MNYSEEQKYIIRACKDGSNVVVDAVAGSGKTTTLLGIATACPEERILAILFNRSLKEETRLRAQNLSLTLLEVHNYHALARKYYDTTIQNDSGITKVLKQNSKPVRQLPQWSRLVIDEVQDMNPLYYRLIKKLIHDLNNPKLKLTVMGDRFQSIYAFLQADARFLTHADQIYNANTSPWVRASLSTTYRCSKTICAFVNESLIGYDRLKPSSNSAGFPVTYIYGSPFDAHRYLHKQILQFLDQGYKPDDIFILAPSVKMKMKDTPVKILENSLVHSEIPVYVPSEDEIDISHGADGNPTQGKVVITTFHQSKGLERQIVIIYNFDDSYHAIFNKEADPEILSSELYVAITRCKKHLFVIHDMKQPTLRYLKNLSDEFIKIVNSRGQNLDLIPEKAPEKKEKPRTYIFKASEMTNYLTAEAILEARNFLEIRTISDPYTKIPLHSMIETAPKRFEIVSDLNGIAIPAIYEWRLRKNIRIAQEEDKEGTKFGIRYAELKRKISPIQEPAMPIVLEIANIFSSMDSGYHYKVAQIKDYNWATNEDIEPCMRILEENLDTTDIQYEVVIPEQVCTNYTIMGRIDAFSLKKNTLWELKCTDSLDATHEIQLGIYAWMFSRQFPTQFSNIQFHLLNMRTGECRQILAQKKALDEMVAFLVAEKTRRTERKSDEEFIKEFAGKFDPTQSNLKQLTIPNMVKSEQKAMFLDDDELALPSAEKVEKPKNTIKAPIEKPMIQTVLSPITSPPVDQTPSMTGRVLVFDLETTGLPVTPSFGTYYPPQELDKYRQSRIVQWSWALYEPDGTLLAEEDHIIKPNPVEYRIDNSQFHGITDQIARVQGKDFTTVLTKWSAHLEQATTVVGHNVNFDRHVLLSELHRRKFLQEATEFESKHWICTMQRAKELCALRAGNKLKPPKLIELMHALNVEQEPGRNFHNSKHDVFYTAKCFFAEQVLKNPCPKMYEGKHKGKTYDEIFKEDRDYVINAHAVCNVRKLYGSPLRKLSNWVKPMVAKDEQLKEDVKKREHEIRSMTDI